MPPPNITGQLHLGHAYFGTLQDIIARYKRMRGHATLWLPGTDHGGIGTQDKLDALMRAQGLDPAGPAFDAFAATFKTSTQDTITGQLRRIGASCDWSRERFTLDAGFTTATIAALRRCHAAGMLYERDGQWWLDMSGLARRLLACLDAGELTIIPAFEEKTLRHDLENIEPWCLSRQIRWGHRIPIWRLPGGGIAITDECPELGATRAPDILDTWFSSALWPFATLGWPDRTDDLERFYPADLLETGSDILFMWCARMLMMGLLLTDRLPFKTLFLHGIIRDEQGRKMSKSEGNGIDPLDVIRRYGCDAMRTALAEDTTPGQDMRLWDAKFQAGRAQGLKLWNAARFALRHHTRMGAPPIARPEGPRGDDATLLADLDAAIREATEALEAYDFRRYAFTLRHFLWDRLCSWYIEAAKDRLYADDRDALATLTWALTTTLRLLHPMAPFITERIWGAFADTPLISTPWPDGGGAA